MALKCFHGDEIVRWRYECWSSLCVPVCTNAAVIRFFHVRFRFSPCGIPQGPWLSPVWFIMQTNYSRVNGVKCLCIVQMMQLCNILDKGNSTRSPLVVQRYPHVQRDFVPIKMKYALICSSVQQKENISSTCSFLPSAPVLLQSGHLLKPLMIKPLKLLWFPLARCFPLFIPTYQPNCPLIKERWGSAAADACSEMGARLGALYNAVLLLRVQLWRMWSCKNIYNFAFL